MMLHILKVNFWYKLFSTIKVTYFAPNRHKTKLKLQKMAASVVNTYADPYSAEWMNAPHSTGTSIMACEFAGGVVIGADSRTTTGAYIANRVTDKLTKITDHIYCCRSGSAADTQAIADIVKYHLSKYVVYFGSVWVLYISVIVWDILVLYCIYS